MNPSLADSHARRPARRLVRARFARAGVAELRRPHQHRRATYGPRWQGCSTVLQPIPVPRAGAPAPQAGRPARLLAALTRLVAAIRTSDADGLEGVIF